MVEELLSTVTPTLVLAHCHSLPTNCFRTDFLGTLKQLLIEQVLDC